MLRKRHRVEERIKNKKGTNKKEKDRLIKKHGGGEWEVRRGRLSKGGRKKEFRARYSVRRNWRPVHNLVIPGVRPLRELQPEPIRRAVIRKKEE